MRELDLRYTGQGYELRTPLEGLFLDRLTAASLQAARERFDERHAHIHGHAAKERPVELVSYRLRVRVAVPKYATLSETQLRHSVKKKFFHLTILTVFLICLYLVFSPFIFKFLFPKYLESVFYSQIYVLGMVTIPGLSLFSNYFVLKKSTRTLYKLSIISNLSTIIITFIFIYKYGAIGAVISNCVSWLVMLVVHMYYFYTDKPNLSQVAVV